MLATSVHGSVGPEATHYWRQAKTSRDQQARQHLPANVADPRCQSGTTLVGEERYAARRVAARLTGKVPPQHRGRGARQQVGENRLGAHAAGKTFSLDRAAAV